MLNIYRYKISSLQDEVEKRTSMIGRMRSTESSEHLLERMSLTGGDESMFVPFLEDAVYSTYDWLKAFGKREGCGVEIYPDKVVHDVYENGGVRVYIDGAGGSLRERKELNDTSGFYIYADNETERRYALTFTPPTSMINISGDFATKVNYKVRLGYVVGAEGTPFEDEHVKEWSFETTESASVELPASDIYFPRDTSIGTAYLKRLSYYEVEVVSIEHGALSVVKGDYVRYVKSDDSERYFRMSRGWRYEDGDAFLLSSGEELSSEDIGSVVFTLERYDWQQEGALRKVCNDIFEALVNYVIHRWFSIVNSEESDYYGTLWELKCQNAQTGLNSESRILQRKAAFI